MANVLIILYKVIQWVFWLYSLFIVINAILSWVPALNNSVVGQWLNKIVNPYLDIFRKGPLARLAYSTGIDFSPIIALLVLYLVQDYVLVWIFNILFRLLG